MSTHSYTRCWLHMTWSTLKREPILPKAAAVEVSGFFNRYAAEKEIYIVTNYVNPEHVHVLLDLPTSYSIENVVKLFKGASSHWINQERIIKSRFRWGRGYGAFSVSHSRLETVARYVANQEEHHRRKTFVEEYGTLMRAHDLKWSEEDFS
jgi:putative transposase